MSRRGNCWDNAVAESFFGSLKKERIKKHIYKDRDAATKDIADYIDSFYNPTRRHSHLGGVSPAEFEAESAKPQPGPPVRVLWTAAILHLPRALAKINTASVVRCCSLRSFV
jgi:Integrase core domain